MTFEPDEGNLAVATNHHGAGNGSVNARFCDICRSPKVNSNSNDGLVSRREYIGKSKGVQK
jgi:hypothetical protein